MTARHIIHVSCKSQPLVAFRVHLHVMPLASGLQDVTEKVVNVPNLVVVSILFASLKSHRT